MARAEIALPFRDRIRRLRSALRARGVEAMLVADAVNLRFLSGFQSTYARLIIDRASATLITDGRYRESAEKQLTGWTVLCQPGTAVDKWWKQVWTGRGYKTLGFEGSSSWSQVEEWKRQIRPTKLAEAGDAVRSLRRVKDKGEIATLRKSARLADAVMAGAIRFLRPGRTELDVSREIRRLADAVGAEGESFPNIVAAGPNSSRPHHHPGSRKLRKGDMVILDLGVVWKGYCSDMTRTVVLGSCSDAMRKVYERCLESQLAALKAVRAGASARDPDTTARNVLSQWDLEAYFVHGLGHGVGLEIHEAPTLNARSGDRLETNMAVTVEPGVYLPGRFGVRIEDLVIVGAKGKGATILSKSPKALRIV